MNTARKRAGKLLVRAGIAGGIIFMLIFCVSHFYYQRSCMATVSELYMMAVDRDSIYEEGDGYIENITQRAEKNLYTYTRPEGVKMDVPYYYRWEHEMQTFYFNEDSYTDTLVIYVHGGAYLNNPLKYHWKLINNVALNADCPVIMPIYLKVPNYTCDEAYERMMDFYLEIASTEGLRHIILMGDSSGGAMALVLAQKLRDLDIDVLEPEELVLIAPWMDVTMENEDIVEIEPVDTMLGLYGLIDIGEKWAGTRDPHDSVVSPIYGTFDRLGHITLFAGTKDMLYPDIIKFSQILTNQGIDHELIVRKGLNHPYPLFPTPEAAEAQKMMIEIVKQVKAGS